MYCFVLVSSLIALANSKASYLDLKTPMLDGRIVGGKNTTIQEHPYQASLQVNGAHSCGASLIKPDVAVTAAHCTNGKESSVNVMAVRVGTTIRGEGGQVAKVRSIHPHPKYDHDNSDNFDVCILVLDRSFTINEAVQTIPLQPVNMEVPTGKLARITGWGALVSGGTAYKVLQKVDVPKVDQRTCEQSYPFENISDNMHCFGYPEGGKDACQGDSGGPLVVGGNLVGIVSWGYGCGWAQLPGVYCKIANPEVQKHIRSVAEKHSKHIKTTSALMH